MKRELRSTKINSKVYLFPVPVVKDRKYLVFCASMEEAGKVSQAVLSEKVVHPDLISEDFIFLTYHTDNETKIFVPNPEKFQF